MKIEVGGEYTTHDCKAVRIYSTDGKYSYPIHGAVFEDDEWRVLQWDISGTYCRNSLKPEYRLVAVKEYVWLWRFHDKSISPDNFLSEKDVVEKYGLREGHVIKVEITGG